MGKLFDSVKLSKPKTSKFDLSHERKMSMNMGDLVPMFVQEVLPSDRFRVTTEIMARMAPMLAPIMHRVNVKIDYFNIPTRLIWEDYEAFFTGGKDGTLEPVMPFVTTVQAQAISAGNAVLAGTLWDFMGLPILGGIPVEPVNINMLPFRAYQLVYNEFYRDQNLSDPNPFSLASGQVSNPDASVLLEMRHSCWEKDYFTSCLPFAQRGPAVQIPIDIEGDAPLFADPINGGATSTTIQGIEQPGAINVGYGIGGLDPTIGGGDIVARLSGLASSTTITELRRSIRLQEWLERMATAGARYVEQLRSMWKVKPQDARMQRPEYLGGGRAHMSISEVLSTVQQVVREEGVPVEVGTPQGDMAGHGFAIGNQNGFTYSVKEHGYIIGILRILPKTAYQQGIPRMYSRFDKFDFAWPQFAQIGEQEVKYQELYYVESADTHAPGDTFGYQSRYAEYKYGCSTVHGEFKTNLAYWHMGRIFSGQPELNDGFVEADPTDRIFAVENAPSKIYVHLFNKVDAIRPLPYFGTPTL